MKAARQYLRAVKVWGIGPEQFETRQQFKRRQQAEKLNNCPVWLQRKAKDL